MVCCEDCLVVCEVSTCGELLTIGTIDPGVDVNVYVKNTATKREQVQHITSDGAGLVQIAFNDPSSYFYAAGADYQIWITDRTAQNKSSALEVLVVGDSALGGIDTHTRCILATFRNVFIEENIHDLSQILTARP